MERIAVLGSNSFSGQDFVDLLLEETDAEVLAISRSAPPDPCFLRYAGTENSSRLRFRQMCLNRDADRILETLDEFRPGWIVNFASQSEVAPSWEHPEQWFQTNAVAVARLANHLRAADWLERYLHISTPEVYGSCRGDVREDQPFHPSTPYAASRAAGEMMLDVLHDSYGFPVVKVRAANVFGARQQLFKIVPRSAIYLRLGRQIPLHGGGTARRSFIHIRDVSRAELAVLNSGRLGEAYNLATESLLSIRDVVATVCDQAGAAFADCVDVAPARTGHDDAYILNTERARSELSWSPQISFSEGVHEVLEWVEHHWGVLQTMPLEYVHKP